MLDAKLGRLALVEEPEDTMLARAAALGDEHEDRWLQKYRDEFGDWSGSGGGVAAIERAHSADAAAMAAVVDRTLAALDSGANVVFQAAFVDEDFVGFADFLVRDALGRWLVQDSKLARSAKPTALMQLAAYIAQLDRLGIERSDEVQLLLGSGETTTHAVRDLLPLFEIRRERLRRIIAERAPELSDRGEPLAWGDERGDLELVACGRCATCEAEVIANRDLFMVARLRSVQRSKLRTAGIETIDQLATATDAPNGMNPATFTTLREQAEMQLEEERTGQPAFRVFAPHEIGMLPPPNAGDIFFDFEGDPLYTEDARAGEVAQNDLQYLFGWVDNDENYTALWAHSFAEEQQQLEEFLSYVKALRQAHPKMHIYHYAAYEVTKLRQMTSRYGVGEAELAQLLAEGVFVDLLPIVNRSLRIGKRSYSIKKLEPLYMGDELRVSDVQNGGDSILSYVEARQLGELGTPEALEQRDVLLADLADYNRYDCISTLHLRDWLLERAFEAGVVPSEPEPAEEWVYEESELGKALGLATDRAEADGRDDTVWRLAHASIEYYPRENKTFWHDHYERLKNPLNLWEDTKDVLAVNDAESRVLIDWAVLGPRGRVPKRTVELRGSIAPGSSFKPGSQPFALYERPVPWTTDKVVPRAIYGARTVEVLAVDDDSVTIAESAIGGETWDVLPVALTPAAPPRVASIQTALEDWAQRLLEVEPETPLDVASDVLGRRVPRTRSGRGVHENGAASTVDAIVAAVRDLDNSYVAVQGPPGTGKTYSASHVIAKLVSEFGFKVGVVAQSHAVVEHLLDRVVEAGVPAAQVGKNAKATDAPEFTNLKNANDLAGFIAEQPGGFVVGGTAWDITNRNRIGEHSLDLLVIDEAGQFSLASTIAVAQSASNMLLLGDPQQLPQVSQGSHPAPVDSSALGWIMNGAPVLPPEYGFFLEESWRMHPNVSAPVSELAYSGELHSAASAGHRSIAGIAAGVYPRAVRHRDNATESLEEADEVVSIVQDLIGRQFDDGKDTSPRPLAEGDFIVITPYNAQCDRVRGALAAAGFGSVRVGTVDKFQGQEAAVSITSLAASSGKAAPRGSDFVLLENRLNVAISRAQVAAYLVYSPGLLDELPHTAEGIARLSAFARLVNSSN